MEPFRPYVAVHLLFIKDGRVLMSQWRNSGFEEGPYRLPAGSILGDETLRAAAVRLAKEEVGVACNIEDLELKLAMHCQWNGEYLHFFFSPKTWDGEPKNMKPEEYSELDWFSFQIIPENTTPYIEEAIRCYVAGIQYTEFGFKKS